MLTYALQSSLCLAVLYAVWLLTMRRETFFRLNRFVLLCIVVLSLLLPLVRVRIPVSEADAGPSAVIRLKSYQHIRQQEQSRPADWPATIYIIGVALMAAYRLGGLVRIRRKIAEGCLWQQQEQGVTVCCHAGGQPSYSWLSHVVVSETDYELAPEVLQHELAHVRHGHSYDLLLLSLCQCVQWFNPACYLLGRSLRDVHEYEADADVLAGGADATQYQLLLISKAAGGTAPALASSFAYKGLRQRLQMMLRTPSSGWRRGKAALLLPVVMAVGAAVAVQFDVIRTKRVHSSVAVLQPKTAEPQPKPQPQVAPAPAAPETVTQDLSTPEEQPEEQPQKAEEPVPTTVSPTQMAQFPGGNAALRAFIAEHTPTVDWTGQVFVSFVVGEDGSLSGVRLMRGGSDEANEAALSLIAAMPRWVPGRLGGKIVATKYVLPITY